jgi:hypothetical protein
MSGPPLDGARRWLVREVSAMGPDARIAIVRAGAEPKVVLPPSPPGPLVDDAISALTAEKDSASMEQAVALAEGLAASGGQIVILADAPVDGRVSKLERKPEMRVFGRGGGTPDNLGITGLFTRNPSEARDGAERDCTVSIATSSDAVRHAHLVVTLAGSVIADRRVTLEPRGEITEHVAVREAGRIVARVTPDDGKPDAVAIDDEAALTEIARKPPRVALVHTKIDPEDTSKSDVGFFFLEKAIRAAGVKDIVDIDPMLPPPNDTFDVVVALKDGPGRPRGIPTFFAGVNPDDVSHSVLVRKDKSQLRSVAREDPLMRGVSFDGATILHATVPAAAPRGSRSLVELDGGPVLLAGGGGSRSWVWLGVDLEGSDLVLRVAFPVLVANILSELAGSSQIIAAKTAPRSEVALAAPEVGGVPLPPAREPRWRIPTAPSTFLAILGALLLGLEAWLTFRRKWAL